MNKESQGKGSASDMESVRSIALCDPHFHTWDLPNRPNPNLLGAVAEQLPTYLTSDYARDMRELPPQLRLVSRVHVETVVGQMDGGIPMDTVDETRWVCSELEPASAELPFALVAYVHLARDTAESERLLQEHADASGGRLCGVRMILNHHPDDSSLTWPQVESGELLRSSIFRQGMTLLDQRNLSFDLSCNPHQIEDAVKVFRDFPGIRVIINHFGFLHDGEDETHERLWREGMRALAALPNIYVKLSMFWFAMEGFHQDPSKEERVRGLVREMIDTFGCDRCMFASNYPVDKLMGIGISTLYSKFLQWSADLSDADRSALFHDTAIRAYGLV